ncbi:hypothetical protein TIFTF001_055671 [Ficus carica]|uniref:Uncharacterized protein n=1 Tax=Ficus carica TaxID=3494 RepID=A0AA88EK91_FICCA|nr:hypothetical protein TIFTF001_055668 [Ficus carica]GMN72845.1 hypothetical protein TIFTF001_055671 [Ficus carica]
MLSSPSESRPLHLGL